MMRWSNSLNIIIRFEITKDIGFKKKRFSSQKTKLDQETDQSVATTEEEEWLQVDICPTVSKLINVYGKLQLREADTT